jgi:glutaredoxin
MKFRLYTKTACPYCQMAVRLLAENQKTFECYALDNQPELLNEIKSTYNWTSGCGNHRGSRKVYWRLH